MIELIEACKRGDLDAVKYLIEKEGANPNVTDLLYRKTPLHWACELDRLDIIKCLVEHGANLKPTNYYRETPLHTAFKYSNLKVVKYLMAQGANFIDNALPATTLLYESCKRGNLEVVQYLVEEQGVNPKDIIIYTEGSPLYEACKHGNLQLVKYLVELGANLNTPCEGHTPLYWACKGGNLEFVKYLVIECAVDYDASIILHTYCNTYSDEYRKQYELSLAKGDEYFIFNIPSDRIVHYHAQSYIIITDSSRITVAEWLVQHKPSLYELLPSCYKIESNTQYDHTEIVLSGEDTTIYYEGSDAT